MMASIKIFEKYPKAVIWRLNEFFLNEFLFYRPTYVYEIS